MEPIKQEVAEQLAGLVADFAGEVTHDLRPKLGRAVAALKAVKADEMACHSIAIWEQIDAVLEEHSEP